MNKLLLSLLFILLTSQALATQWDGLHYNENAFVADSKVKAIVNKDGICNQVKSNGKVHNLRVGTLESRYCSTIYKFKKKDYFKLNKGSLAEDLFITEYKILEENEVVNSYSFGDGSLYFEEVTFDQNLGLMSSKTKKQSDYETVFRDTDWEELLELNLTAQYLWAKYSKKYGSEKARDLYFKNKLEKDIQIFKKSVIVFLESTELGNHKGLSLLSNFHPLFSQVLIEIFSDVFTFTLSGEKASKTDLYRTRLRPCFFGCNQNFRQGIYLEEEYDIMYYTMNMDSERVSYIPITYGFSSGLEARASRVFKKMANVFILMNMISAKECMVWGLRPELSRIIVQSLNYGYAIVDNNDLQSMFLTLKMRNALACGSIRYNKMPSLELMEEHRESKHGYTVQYISDYVNSENLVNKYLTLNKSNLKVVLKKFRSLLP